MQTVLNNKEDNMSNITDITMYDLMAEDLTIWVQKNKQFGFDLSIEGDDPSERIEISGVHSGAMESFSDFCRRFLHFYDKAKEI
jgi:hypothetical protein